MGTKRTNIEIVEGLATEDVLALRGSGWDADLDQLRSGWSRGEGVVPVATVEQDFAAIAEVAPLDGGLPDRGGRAPRWARGRDGGPRLPRDR